MKGLLSVFLFIGIALIITNCTDESQETLLLPEADFSFEVNEFTVKFFTQTKNVDKYSWDFGDGNANLTSNPTHTYEKSGSYEVKLVATGNGESVTVQKTVEVSVPPEISFTYSVDGFTVTFDSDITNADSYEWDFGDGATGDEKHPVHTFNEAGEYIVILSASSYGGSVTTKDTIIIEEPLAISFSSTVNNYTINLNVDNDTLQYYFWSFGNGDFSNEINPEYTYPFAGEYTVNLTVGHEGDSAFHSEQITIIAPEPTIELSVTVDANDPSKVNISVTDEFVDTYSWDYGDGSTSTEQGSHSYSYQESGQYLVSVTVEGEGGTAMTSKTVDIQLYPIDGVYVVSQVILQTDLVLPIEIIPGTPVIIPEGTDITQEFYDSFIKGEAPCDDPTNGAIELRNNNEFYFTCIGETSEVKSGTWSINSDTTELSMLVYVAIGSLFLKVEELYFDQYNKKMGGILTNHPITKSFLANIITSHGLNEQQIAALLAGVDDNWTALVNLDIEFQKVE